MDCFKIYETTLCDLMVTVLYYNIQRVHIIRNVLFRAGQIYSVTQKGLKVFIFRSLNLDMCMFSLVSMTNSKAF